MSLRDEIEQFAGSITYLTTGQLQRHLLQLESQITGTNDELMERSEPEFRQGVLARLSACEADIAEIVAGVNALWEGMKSIGFRSGE